MADDPTTLSWTVHPLVENKRRSLLLACFLLLLFLGIYWSFGSLPLTVLCAIFLIGSLYKYFLPFHHHCAADSLIISSYFYRLERPWSAFRRFYVDKNGVFLSPFAHRTRLENFRGVYVRFGTHVSEEIIGFIRAKIEANTAS